MIDDILANSPQRVRGRPFQKGRSGNPAGRRPGSRNEATIAVAKLLAGEGEAGRIAAVVDTFVRAIETSDFEERLKELEDRQKAQDATLRTRAGSTWPHTTDRRGFAANLLQIGLEAKSNSIGDCGQA